MEATAATGASRCSTTLPAAWRSPGYCLRACPKKAAARRLGCNRTTVSGWIKAYLDSGKWWPDPVIRNRHADNVLYDTHFLRAVDAVLRSDPEQFIGEIKDVFTFLSTLPG